MANTKLTKQSEKQKYVGLWIDPALQRKLKKAADVERRSVSQFIRVVLERSLEAKSA